MKFKKFCILGLVVALNFFITGCSMILGNGELDAIVSNGGTSEAIAPVETTSETGRTDTTEDIFNFSSANWNNTGVPNDIANHAFNLALSLYIQQYYIPTVDRGASYESVVKDGALVCTSAELVESEYSADCYSGTMGVSFNPQLKGTGLEYDTTLHFDFYYDPNTGYVTFISKSWVIGDLMDYSYTDDPEHMTLNMTAMTPDTIFDLAKVSSEYYIESVVLPSAGLSSLDEFFGKGCSYEYDREGRSGIRVVQIGDIAYSLTMGLYVDARAAAESTVVPIGEYTYFDEITVYYYAENIGEADQSITPFYFGWPNKNN